MIAYFVHNPETQHDTITLPDMGCTVAVDGERMEAFISVNPVFAQWSGDACSDLSPEDFGTVIATREESGDVCVLKPELWQQRLKAHLGEVKPEVDLTA